MNRGFTRDGDELGKERSREAVIGDHALRVPLRAGDPVGIAGPFERFDHAIGRMRHDAKIFSGSEDGLVMRTVDANFVGAGQLRKARTWFERDRMMRFGTGMAGPRMLNFGGDFRGDVLNQRAAEKNIQTLGAVADGEDRFLLFEGVSENRKVGGFTAGIGNRTIGVDSGLE